MSEPENQHEVTRLIQAASAANRAAADQLLALVYDELRKIAQQRMNAERADHTLQATALVHEAYVRLLGQTEVHWQNRAHFLGVAAEAMRRILVDRARRRDGRRARRVSRATLVWRCKSRLTSDRTGLTLLRR